MTRVALLFPGQGAQRGGLLHGLPSHPVVRETLDEAAQALAHTVGPGDDGPRALDAPSRQRDDTVAIQLALLIAGTASARLLLHKGVVPDVVAGHSVGAVSAAVAAGALELREALDLVHVRAHAMAAAFPPERGYGMAALTGLGEPVLERVLRCLREKGHETYLAAVNAPDQMVVSGSRAGLDRVTQHVATWGVVRSRRLTVPVPSHCPLLAPIADTLERHLTGMTLRAPRCGWVSNVSGRVLRDPDHIARDLALSVARPVRWYAGTAALYERGVRLFLEASPGAVLTGLAAAAFPDARAHALSPDGEYRIESAVELLRRRRKFFV